MNIVNLENWYLKNHRKLAFRENHHPYYIWVSEIMLQQTQVDTVIPYFKRFIKTYPSVFDLAKASEDALYHLVQGLGYYRRFKHMHQAAKVIVEKHQGIFPKTYKEIIALPGIGEYSVGAIMSIAFNQPVSATDGNVIRVLSRVYNIDKDMRLEKHKKDIKTINQSLIVNGRPAIYTQALMELGALICRPKKPLCDSCPIQKDCLAYGLNRQEDLPVLSKKPKKKKVHYKTLVIQEGDYTYLRKRTERLLGGMYEFPQFDQELPINYEVIKHFGEVKHVFTHLIWVMDIYKVQSISKPLDGWIKVKLADIKNYPMSVAHKKVLKQVYDF